MPATLSDIDAALREFVKYWSISDETVDTIAKNYQKPIVTGLEKQQSGSHYFVVFKYRNSIHSTGQLTASQNKADVHLDAKEIESIKNQVNEICLELDKEFIIQNYGMPQNALRIEKALVNSGFESQIRDLDLSQITKKDRQELLSMLTNVQKLPPWKKEEQIGEKIISLKQKMKLRGYQKSFDNPKLLAVIKYD